MDIEQEEKTAVTTIDESVNEAQNGTNGLKGASPDLDSHAESITPVEDVAEPGSVVINAPAPVLPPLTGAAKAEHKVKVEEYLKARWEDQYNYYSNKATTNKKVYQRVRLSVALIGFLIPVTVTLPDLIPTFVPALLGVAVSFLTAWETIYRYGDNWRSFRHASEELKRERVYFETGAGPYAHKHPQEAFIRFVENCEAVMAQESGSFFKRDSQQQSGGQGTGAG